MQGKGFIALVLVALAAGCTSREAICKQLRADNPRAQSAMIARVVRQGDRSMAGELIDLLESEDEGVRFMAAAGLRKLTGIDRGFHFAKAEDRKRIIAEWREWWQTQGGKPSTPPEEKGTGPAEAGPDDASPAGPKESGS